MKGSRWAGASAVRSWDVGQIEGAVTKLAKPQTFMNLSGHAVSCLLRKINSESPVEAVGRDFRRSGFAARKDSHSRTRLGRRAQRAEVDHRRDRHERVCAIANRNSTRASDLRSETLCARFVFDEVSGPIVLETIEQSAKAIRTIIRDGALKAMTEFN